MTLNADQWRPLKRLECYFFSWVVAGLILPFTVSLAVPQLIEFHSASIRESVGYLFLGTWAGGAFLLRLWLGTFKCPRCGFSFYGGERVPRKTCVHCGVDRKLP
jgi:hypothetical protein